MSHSARDVVITGVGLVTSLGEGFEAHAGALADPSRIVLNREAFAPYSVHPTPAMEYDRQIPKKLDQKQMEPWQRLGTYAAGMALEMAGLKGDRERLSNTQLIVAAGGGERDYVTDGQILSQMSAAANPAVLLNERLMSDLRPTMFLAQLSNLLAGNISIVHGVTGASRTFMGEEQCGVDAFRIACERIRAGQGNEFLVGGSYNAERPDSLLIYAMGKFLRLGDGASVWNRNKAPGFHLGSGGAFLMLEARETAEARGATPLAVLDTVTADRSPRQAGSVRTTLTNVLAPIKKAAAGKSIAVLSGATGVAGITDEERDAIISAFPQAPIRATGSHIGHLIEGQFPAGLALAVLALQAGSLFAPGIGNSVEQASDLTPDAIVVTSVGHRRGEGAALVSRAV